MHQQRRSLWWLQLVLEQVGLRLLEPEQVLVQRQVLVQERL